MSSSFSAPFRSWPPQSSSFARPSTHPPTAPAMLLVTSIREPRRSPGSSVTGFRHRPQHSGGGSTYPKEVGPSARLGHEPFQDQMDAIPFPGHRTIAASAGPAGVVAWARDTAPKASSVAGGDRHPFRKGGESSMCLTCGCLLPHEDHGNRGGDFCRLGETAPSL